MPAGICASHKRLRLWILTMALPLCLTGLRASVHSNPCCVPMGPSWAYLLQISPLVTPVSAALGGGGLPPVALLQRRGVSLPVLVLKGRALTHAPNAHPAGFRCLSRLSHVLAPCHTRGLPVTRAGPIPCCHPSPLRIPRAPSWSIKRTHGPRKGSLRSHEDPPRPHPATAGEGASCGAALGRGHRRTGASRAARAGCGAARPARRARRVLRRLVPPPQRQRRRRRQPWLHPPGERRGQRGRRVWHAQQPVALAVRSLNAPRSHM